MLNFSNPEWVQLAIGAVVGSGLSIQLDLHGISLSVQKTRWCALAIIVGFAVSYLALTDFVLSCLGLNAT